jgi:hypothetical protein
MSIDQLQRLVPPPEVPAYVPTESDWVQVRAELGVDFPEELRRFCAVYGMGTFRGAETTALSVGCPGYLGFVADFRSELQRLREIRGPRQSDDYPFAVFPEDRGLLPLALDECDVWICWVSRGRPDEWPILVRWTWGVAGLRVFDMPLSELLVALFDRTIELPCFPPPTFVDDVRFVPYEEGKTIGGDPLRW